MKIGFMPDDHQQRFATTQALALAAEDAGFESFWMADHLYFRFDDKERGIWEVFTFLSALAATTKRIKIAPMVACTSFRNPALLAKIADAMDEVSNGRFILGLGAGWHQPEYDAFGYPFDHLASRFEEALQIIVPLLREGHVDFTGKYVQAHDTKLIPRGPTPSGPPILIGAGRPRMLGLVAKYADAWNTAWHLTPGAVTERYAKLLAACEVEGRDPATLMLTAGTQARILAAGETPDPEQAEKAIWGTVEEMILAFRGFAEVGVKHLIVIIPGATPEQVTRFAPVVAALADA